MEEQVNVEQSNEQQRETLDAIISQYSSFSKEELVKELKTLIEDGDFEQLRTRVPLLRNAFSTLSHTENVNVQSEQTTEQSAGQQSQTEEQTESIAESETAGQPVGERKKNEEDPLTEEFYTLYNVYKQKRQEYQQKQEEEKQENLKKKQVLLEEIKTLLDSDKTLKEVYDEFNTIQEKWKSIGNVPHTEVNTLWESYHFLMDKFYEKVKINRELRDLDLKKNLEQKLILCEKAEELLLSDDINNSFRILQEYHRQWKEIGGVPSDKNDEVWNRFKQASDAINARRKEYYDKRVEELEENLRQKRELIEQASQINSHKREKLSEWNADTEQMTALVEKWKTIGPVPHQYNDEVWNQFRAQKDGFFDAKKEVLLQTKQVEQENYNKKIAICEAAEEIVKRTDFDRATIELKQLQEDWKQIGYIRKSQSDQLWKRFRAACDEFFRLKSEEYMRTHQEVEENIQKKQALIQELKEYVFTEDKTENVNKLKEFQKRWFEVGFTPKEERQKLQKQWDEVINANREKLQITASEIASKASSGVVGVKTAGKEALNSRVRVLQEQIDRLENNLGFLASSRNADLLKKEFEHKISRLRREKDDLLKRIKEVEKESVSEEKASSEEQKA